MENFYLMSDLKLPITSVSDFIKRYKSLNSIRFKCTLGKYTDIFGFEKNLFHEEEYNKIMNLLNKCSTWEYKEEKYFEKFKSEPDKIIDTMIILCENGPYDIIITAETVKTNSFYISDDFYFKQNTFIKKNHEFILTEEIDNFKDKVYNMTIIPIIQSSYTDTYISHSTLLKICDLISVCNNNANPLILTILQKNN